VPEKGANSPFFVVKYRASTLPHSRFAIVVSKKIDKRATVRNRVKRRISHVLQKLMREYTFAVDAIVYVRKAVVEADSDTIEKSIQQIFIKEDIIKNHD